MLIPKDPLRDNILLNNLLLDYFSPIDIEIIKTFITEQGKILPRRATGLSVQQHRKIGKAIKRARKFSLLPFVASNANEL